ncbi:pyridoxamine 5'-phosphate oxidase [Pseudoduganella chitinolytica]|uniref:Pyridoxine/pyridoxamine 5'-phosphate oxidase n=1 Tax=Pseudoduganella chitinolytica TaxID=34070 RepID=A0ABY8B6B2_9BURK|nr:pyridoxamine 5'-phosphate oxidase [Pseudoduganella chitinolytica]WEF31415.1 pyridoxamine 5'-phosphate oxidase [Pseudoduganella chitinolytica]
MSESLMDAVPGFDQPIAVLKHCHDKIRKQLKTLQNLLAHLPRDGADAAAQGAAQAVLKYFNTAAHLHHADEEQDLLPMLEATATGADLELIRDLKPQILAQHQQMDRDWHVLNAQLERIAAGSSTELSADDVARFVQSYTAHMETEESHVAPMAKRLFSPAQMQVMGDAMQRRRGISADPEVPAPQQATPTVTAAAIAGGIALADLRMDYGRASLSEEDTLDDPVAQFTKWFGEAMKAQVNEPNAMSVATVGSDGRPTSRIVLIKQYDERGFTWYTNYDSQKGRQLADNPHAALLFFWPELERQVRIEGRVERTAAEESDKYFYSRPVKSQLAAIASAQSAPIANRAEMEARYAAVEAASGDKPQRPDHWGGYRLVPERIEFWQGRRSRFHDRIVYTRQADGSWQRGRIQP